jgi:rhodanese-related sulfurtransferase
MGILDYFKPGSTWPPDQVQRFLDQKSPQECSLVDVRTPKEYETEHLPGAHLIPVAGWIHAGRS